MQFISVIGDFVAFLCEINYKKQIMCVIPNTNSKSNNHLANEQSVTFQRGRLSSFLFLVVPLISLDTFLDVHSLCFAV